MNEEEFHQLDFYKKLSKINYISGTLRRDLEKITRTAEAQGFDAFWDIEELLEEIEKIFLIFATDEELNRKENWRHFGIISDLKKDVLEVIPLIKSKQIKSDILIEMLISFEKELEANLPRNIRLAQVFQKLLVFKKEIAFQLGIEENIYEEVIGKMALNSGIVDSFLKRDANEELEKNKKGL